MGRPYYLVVPAVGALCALVACAGLAGLEAPDPTAGSNLDGDGGGGGTGSILTPEKILITPEKVDITTSCAGNAATQYISLHNQGEMDAPYEVQVPEGSPFALRDDKDASVATLRGVLAKGQILLVYLRAISTQAGNFSGQIFLTVAGRVKPLPVHVTVNGGALAFVPAVLDFGEVRRNTSPPPQNVELENTGTEPVNILKLTRTPSTDAGADFAITTPSINIAAHQKATVPVTFLPGDAGPQVTADFVPETETPTCGAVPKLTVKGTRVNQDVTVNPPTLGYGDVDCLSAGGATKTITVSNYATGMAAAFTVSAPADSWFDVVPASTSVPPATGDSNPGKTNITVTLKPVGKALGDHNEAINVVITSPVAATKTTIVSTKNVGAILAFDPVALTFTAGQTKQFIVRNTGNKFAYVKHTSSNTAAFSIVNNTSETPLSPGPLFGLNVDVKFVATPAGTYTADITTARASNPLYPASGTLCEPPAVVKATGTN